MFVEVGLAVDVGLAESSFCSSLGFLMVSSSVLSVSMAIWAIFTRTCQ